MVGLHRPRRKVTEMQYLRCSLPVVALIIFGGGTILADVREEIRAIFDHRSELNRCGPYSLQVCASFIGAPIAQEEVLKYLPNDGRVTTFYQLANAAGKMGFTTAAFRWDYRPILPSSAPAILAGELNGVPHFVAGVDISGDRVLIIDFPNPNPIWISCQRLREKYHWKGEALHISRSRLSIVWLHCLLRWKVIVVGVTASVMIMYLILRWRSRRVQARLCQLYCIAVCIALTSGCDGGISKTTEQIARIEPDSVSLDASKDANEKGECETVLHVLNDSRKAIRIRKITASCGCTSVGTPTKKLLNHGETADIRIRVQLPTIGEKRSRVTVLVEAESVQHALVTTFLMRGHPIQAPAIINVPKEVVMRCDADGNATAVVRVRTYEKTGSPPWIASAAADRAIVSVQSAGMDESRSSEPGVNLRVYTYSLKAKRVSESSTQNRNSDTRITLRAAAHSDTPLASFYVRLQEWQPVRLVPEALFLEQVNGTNNNIVRDVRVAFCDERFHPTSVDATSSVSWIHVKSIRLINDGDRKEALLAVELRPGHMPSGRTVRASLLVKAHGDHADSADVTLPVIIKRKPSE